jgi:ABC transport system ATP-binding/permease protein
MAPLLQLQDVALSFGGTPLLTGVDLTVDAGERLCLVGRNGSGKSTLLRIAAGLIEPDNGARFLQPGTTIRYLPQEPDFSGATMTLDYVEAGLAPGDDPHQARYLLQLLGLTGSEKVNTLSGGESRRAALARVLAPSPDILLLDEPTNHLDLTTIEWLEAELTARRSAVILISHDRRFLANLSRGTAWLDRGRIRRLDRGFAGFEEWRDGLLADEERAQHKLDRKIVAEEHWLRYGVTARRKRNMRRLAQLHALRQSRREYRAAAGKAVLTGPLADKSGSLVIEAQRIGKAYGERPIVTDFSIRIRRGDRIGFVGPNGSGKTTLLNLITGGLAPDSGTVRIGANVVMATLDQQRESLDPTKSVIDTLTGGAGDSITVGGRSRHVVGYLKDFLFPPAQARTPVGVLSGGERGRLMLARALAKPANMLVLDEPTNDLDLETLDMLQEMLADYAGTVLLISHDRDFLDRVVNGVIVPEGNGRWNEYAGGYSDMLAQRGADLVRERTETAKPAPATVAEDTSVRAARPTKRRLSFNEKHALEKLPGEISALQTKIGAMHARLSDPNLYARERAAFEQASAELAAAEKDLAAAEERWLELEILREDVAGQ